MRKLAIEELNRVEITSYKAMEKLPVAVVLDNIRSMSNIGSAFRTADAMLVEKIWLCGITAQPPHREINKTALGATESVDWEYTEKPEDVIAQLKAAGYMLIAVEQVDKATPLQKFRMQPHQKYAFVFGHEVNGVSQTLIEACDLALEIPQFGTKHSLNVTVSIGMVLWHYMNQRLG